MSVYKLSDKVKKKRLKKWICVILQISVFVGAFIWTWFTPEDAFVKGVIAFALFMLIAQVKEIGNDSD